MHDKIESNRNVKLKVLYSLRWCLCMFACACAFITLLLLFLSLVLWLGESNFVWGPTCTESMRNDGEYAKKVQSFRLSESAIDLWSCLMRLPPFAGQSDWPAFLLSVVAYSFINSSTQAAIRQCDFLFTLGKCKIITLPSFEWRQLKIMPNFVRP